MKPRKEKRARVYELYQALGEFTHLSKHYHSGVPLYHVAARSLNEALRLAERGTWYTKEAGVGVLEHVTGDNPWHHWDGPASWDQGYFHGKVVK